MPGWPYLVIYKNKDASTLNDASNILYQGGAVRKMSGSFPSFTDSTSGQAYGNWRFINVPKDITGSKPMIRIYQSYNSFENRDNYEFKTGEAAPSFIILYRIGSAGNCMYGRR